MDRKTMTVARIVHSRPSAREQDAPAETSRVGLAEDGRLVGFVFDPAFPERRFSVEILLDGLVVATGYADSFVPELFKQGISDGSYGFVVKLGPEQLAAARTVEARLANLGTPVGRPIDLLTVSRDNFESEAGAGLRWLGGLRFSGWIDSTTEKVLDAVVDGETVSQLRTTHWTRVEENGDTRAGRNVRAFDFHLPQRFADGRVHKVTLRQVDGEPLPVSGTFVAFPDGLAATLAAMGGYSSEQLRGELYDHLIPASLPLADYAAWRERFPLPSPHPSHLELAVVVAGSAGSEQTLVTLENQSHETWTAAVLDLPPLAIEPDLVAQFLCEVAPDANVVVIAMAGISLEPNALARIAAAFDAHPEATALYGDLDLLGEDGRLWPIAFPAFDYERMLEQGYCAHLFALRREVAKKALQSAPNNLYRLFNAILDHDGPQQCKILHLPGALATLPKLDRSLAALHLKAASSEHLRARGIEPVIEPGDGTIFPAIKVQRPIRRRKTTVIIPTRDRLALLRTCLESIEPAVARSRAEILVVDNDSADPDTLDYLDGLPRQGIKTLRIEGPFNFARLNNRAVAMVDSDALCLLNNDIEAHSDDWLDEMLTRLAEPDVAAVGALLTWPGGVVQHGGVVLGVNFQATHAFTDRLAGDPGYLDLLRVAHECSAVSAACLVTRRDDYLRVGGMDETHFAVAFNDVDYCLKLRQAGQRIVFTPHARLIHAESASRGKDDRPDRRHRFERELNMLRARWGEFLIKDPTYHPQLSRDGVPYSALAWPPGRVEPRLNKLPEARDLPQGL
jgi:GT2 family glycosyltransferase